MESVSLVAGSDLGRHLAEIVEEAAELILPYWRSDLAVDRKADESPVTEADRRAEELILERLAKLYPKIPVIAEEQVEAAGATPDKAAKRFFLVDPLDGTKGFVRGTEAFTVNIGLVDNGQPVAGAVAAPATGQVWFTTNDGAFRRKVKGNDLTQIRVRQKPASGGVALVSHTLTDEEAQRLAGRHGCPVWQGMDSSVKFCLIAEGRADIYPRPGRTMEWDTAAADAILRAAGGRVLTDDGQPLIYGKAAEGFANPGFLAVGG
jgi:3'(2'), 5'-bisphosphate nucleotidase